MPRRRFFGWGAMYSEVAFIGTDEDVRKRMLAEWGSVATVSSLLSGMVYSPFINPPSAIRNSTDNAGAYYGVVVGMAIASCFTAVLTCTFFSLFLNSVPKGCAAPFVSTFAPVLPIPILNLVAAIILLTISVGIVAAKEYEHVFIFLATYLGATFTFLCIGGGYIFWHVHLRHGLERHPLFAAGDAVSRPKPAAQGTLSSLNSSVSLLGQRLSASGGHVVEAWGGTEMGPTSSKASARSIYVEMAATDSAGIAPGHSSNNIVMNPMNQS